MDYFWIHVIHLIAAAFFIGGVFFEVLVVSPALRKVSRDAHGQTEAAIGSRARHVMPWVIVTLYMAGIALGWHHRAALANPMSNSFSLLLSLKIALALSILAHFIAAVILMKLRLAKPRWLRLIHSSVLVQIVIVLLLAKAMFYPW